MSRYGLLFVLVLAFLATISMPAAVQAHADLVRSDHAVGAVLPTASEQAHLWFSEAVSLHFARARLNSQDGRSIPLRAVTVDPAELEPMLIDFPALPDGTYTLTWSKAQISAPETQPWTRNRVYIEWMAHS